MAPSPDLLASCWTHAGNAYPVAGHDLSPRSIRERAEAVAAAGFVGIGFTVDDLLAAEPTMPYADIKRLLDDLGLRFTEVEFLLDWWTTGPRRQSSDRTRTELLRAAEALGARTIKIGPDVDTTGTGKTAPLDRDRWASELHTLAQQAQDVDARVAIEVLPMSNLPDFTEAASIITAADHPAAGLVVDIWHLERGPNTLDHIANLPPHMIFAVELNDADPEPIGTLYNDTVHHRRLCGQGTFDVSGLIDVLQNLGFPGPWGVEILSAQHRGQDLSPALAAAHDTALAQFVGLQAIPSASLVFRPSRPRPDNAANAPNPSAHTDASGSFAIPIRRCLPQNSGAQYL